MVYASVPPYPDAANWNQIQQQQQPAVSPQQQGLQAMGMGQASGISMVGGAAVQLPQPLSSIPPRSDSTMAGVARPTSMSERARMAKLPQPETALKCPRCDSSNTKFCYFNNYSLSQPRHFCKTCRRYWTRGGALRNVPVGGGCRRNKRSKSSGSKALATADRPAPSSSISIAASEGGVGAIIPTIQTSLQLPYMGSFHDYTAPNLGMGYGAIQAVDQGQFQAGGSSRGNSGFEQWRHQHTQQFPFFAGLEQPSSVPTPSSLGLYQLDSEGGVGVATPFSGQVYGQSSASALITQLASVKMEESGKDRLSMPRQYLGMNPSSDEYWSSAGNGGNGGSGSAPWADLSSAFSSSSTGNLL